MVLASPAVLLAILAAPAAAQEAPRCGPFLHTQRYVGWGPAAAYGRTVIVAYRGTRCSIARGDAVDVHVDGTAAITSTAGRAIATRAFSVDGSWTGASTPTGWPPPWWQCGVDAARYAWQIHGVYTFRVNVTGGLWTLDVSPGGSGPLHWSYPAC